MNLEQILLQENVRESIEQNLKELLILIPEIKYMIGFDHKHPHHHLDVWNHTLQALSFAENDFEIRVAVLFHDIGKPFSYQEGEIRHFYNHPKVSSEITRNVLTRLNYNSDFIDKVCYLVKYHDSPIKEIEILNNPELQIKRYKIQYCDIMAHHPEKLEKRKKYLVRIRKLIDNER